MSFDRTIVVADERGAGIVESVIAANWREMAAAGHPLAVRIFEHKSDATKEQRALLWIRYGEIAAQAWIRGQQFSAETWHIHCKMAFLPEEGGPSKSCRKGYRKWDFLPNGERILVGSTEALTVFGKSEYLEQVMAFGASELGVRFSPTPSEIGMMR